MSQEFSSGGRGAPQRDISILHSSTLELGRPSSATLVASTSLIKLLLKQLITLFLKNLNKMPEDI
jgi:hypothetical protein